jgi:hypothetical protein
VDVQTYEHFTQERNMRRPGKKLGSLQSFQFLRLEDEIRRNF